MDEARVPYLDMRVWLLNRYVMFCRGILSSLNDWSPELFEINYAYNEFEGVFERPIEQLMLEVLTLILIGGRAAAGPAYHQKRIIEILAAHPLEELLLNLPEDELLEFKYDLSLLHLI